ncbi:HK97 gp10 family phage protein [Sphingomonas sp.]|uniref:HK97 gp10 family phage protein n=1 Tax=Sphingomonas sp. TaxID=28214 RepID=UPI00258EB230|nr:HK97 gp10 family phage protein [Sphingomonas sp.]
MKMKVRIEGTDQIARKLKAMGAALRRETLVPIITEELEPMADQMRALAARGTGEMADSVTVGTELSPAQAASNEPIAEIEVYAGPGPLPQAIQEEFGNYRQGPRPFIRPAFDAHVNGAMRNVGERGIGAVLDAANKG